MERNALLRALPAEVRAHLAPDLQLVPMRVGVRLFEPDDPMEWAYFPASGVISVLTVMESGEAVEAATVGNEGMVGFTALLGEGLAFTRALIQVEGPCYRMPMRQFRGHVSKHPALKAAMSQYAATMFAVVAQSAACNRVHQLVERCARWLLMTHDRVPGDEFVMTQEFLSQMLGVRRATVSVTAHGLQEAGLIQYRRGRMRVLDRGGLEALSCECYETIERRFDAVAARS